MDGDFGYCSIFVSKCINTNAAFQNNRRFHMYGAIASFSIASLAKGGYVFGTFGLSVRLSVCLFVDNFTQKVMNGLG